MHIVQSALLGEVSEVRYFTAASRSSGSNVARENVDQE